MLQRHKLSWPLVVEEASLLNSIAIAPLLSLQGRPQRERRPMARLQPLIDHTNKQASRARNFERERGDSHAARLHTRSTHIHGRKGLPLREWKTKNVATPALCSFAHARARRCGYIALLSGGASAITCRLSIACVPRVGLSCRILPSECLQMLFMATATPGTAATTWCAG